MYQPEQPPTAKQLTNCALEYEWTDEYIGRQRFNRSAYCLPACGRSLAGVKCCTPESPVQLGVRFLLFHRDAHVAHVNMSWSEVNSQQIIDQAAGIRKLALLTHGFLESVISSTWMFDARDGYFARHDGPDAVLIIAWDHGGGNAADYFQAIANVRTIGMMIGHVLVSWGVHERTLAVGFSLGAHVLAEAGKYVQMLTVHEKIRECHALDPGKCILFDMSSLILFSDIIVLSSVSGTSALVNGHTLKRAPFSMAAQSTWSWIRAIARSSK